MAEEKIYAERERARAAEEKARWAALGKPPVTQAVNETRTRELEERESARAQQAQRDELRRAQKQYARRDAENAFGFSSNGYSPSAYAPTPNRSQFNSIYSTMRESRGGN
jgi:hypothetical protein